ncbi:prepilin-type N-terminal cleavage/methylation domain-containing protein [Rhodoferax sp.]|uniref:prepilin-type N-terminal cleavage/methylation domain-containing protein n=1 Tax=Rhodoferax sp. TaxID=50421 RepID=UPI002755EC8B|nr:prepilin-type N-terminal cleavage/methylation domain-containing protein [Rhodoferax sp.]
MKREHCNGFTLVEMAIVLLILGLLLGGGLTVLGSQLEQQRAKDTQRLLDEAREALIGFAIVNGRLPRPATSAVNGLENVAACATDLACSGLIPWTTLGTTKADAWGKILRYSVTPAFANANFLLNTVATKKIQTRDTGGALVYLAGQAGVCSAADPCVPVVVFSHGRSHWGTTEAGIAIPDGSGTNVDEDTNQTGGALGVTYVQRPSTEGTTALGGEFDDLVIWLPPGILFNRMVQAGRLP